MAESHRLSGNLPAPAFEVLPEERNMRSWWKHYKKLIYFGKLKPERVALHKRLLEQGRGLGK